MEIVKTVARTTRLWVEHKFYIMQMSFADIETEVARMFIHPISFGSTGNAWVYSSDRIIYDNDIADITFDYKNKSLVDVFLFLKETTGASGYEGLLEDVNKGRDGKGAVTWIKNRGKEYGAWTSISIGDKNWTIGLSTTEEEIYELNNLRNEYRHNITHLSFISVLIFILIFLSFKYFKMTEVELLVINAQLDEKNERLNILKTLTDKAISISQGDFSQRIALNMDNEFNELAKAFNMMAMSIQRVDILKTEFVARAAHELRTPVHTMMLNLSGILEGHSGNLDDEVMEDLRDINESLDRLSNLTVQLLDTSKLEFMDKEKPMGTPVCLNDVVREAIGNICSMCKRFNHTVIHRFCDLPTTTMDRHSMVSAITNLLTNSIKYTPSGGTILILTDINYTENVVKLIVADNGRGIPHWAQDKIFDRFFKWNSSDTTREDSNGLGLYIVKTVVNDHNGVMFVRSPLPPGRFEELALGDGRLGTMFIIKLPIV